MSPITFSRRHSACIAKARVSCTETPNSASAGSPPGPAYGPGAPPETTCSTAFAPPDVVTA
jgi:hypothetical protein